MFRTTGQNDVQHYFVALEYDAVVRDLETAGKMIEQWSGSTIKTFLTPEEADEVEHAKLENLQAITNGPYHAVLATIERPDQLGYWSDNIVIMPDEPLAKKLAGLKPDQLDIVYKFINAQTEGHPEGEPKTNTTPYALSVWPKAEGIELFFN